MNNVPVDATRIMINDVIIHLSQPDSMPVDWIGQKDVLDQLLASWLIINDQDVPLNPRLVGKPGVGKTTLALYASQILEKPLFIFQCTMDTRPEDLLITPVISENNTIKYVASPLVSAMLKGGICVLDESNRMSEKSWASIAPLLDSRRYIESLMVGFKIQASKDFRICATMNEDSSTFDIPEYIQSRLQPQIYLDFPTIAEEHKILKTHLPFIDDEIISYIIQFLQNSHDNNEKFSVRDGINIARYAAKRLQFLNNPTRKTPILHQSIVMILGDAALAYAP